MCAAFDLVGAIVFGLFASGELQHWANDEEALKETDFKEDVLSQEDKLLTSGEEGYKESLVQSNIDVSEINARTSNL